MHGPMVCVNNTVNDNADLSTWPIKVQCRGGITEFQIWTDEVAANRSRKTRLYRNHSPGITELKNALASRIADGSSYLSTLEIGQPRPSVSAILRLVQSSVFRKGGTPLRASASQLNASTSVSWVIRLTASFRQRTRCSVFTMAEGNQPRTVPWTNSDHSPHQLPAGIHRTYVSKLLT